MERNSRQPARRDLGEANYGVKAGAIPVFLSVQFWKCLLNDVNLVTWNDDGIDQSLA